MPLHMCGRNKAFKIIQKTQLIIDVCFFRRWKELKQKNVSCSREIMFGLFDGYITNVYQTSLFRPPRLTLFDYIFHAFPFFLIDVLGSSKAIRPLCFPLTIRKQCTLSNIKKTMLWSLNQPVH